MGPIKIALEIDLPEVLLSKLTQHIDEAIESALKRHIEIIQREQKNYTRIEVAERLRISLPTLDKKLDSGEIKSTRSGRRILISADELERYLVSNLRN